MWELDDKESWVPKNWCFWTMVLKKTLESPFDSKMIKPIKSKENQSWIFTGRAEAEAPILWPSDAKSLLIRKPWSWERLKAGGEGDHSGQGGWMASPTQWTWVWGNSGRWWRTGNPGMHMFPWKMARENTKGLSPKLHNWFIFPERSQSMEHSSRLSWWQGHTYH